MALEIDGIKKNSKIIYNPEDNYAYNIEKRRGNLMYLKCHKKTCHARASTNFDEEDQTYGPVTFSRQNGHHNHEPDEEFRDVIELRRSILERCKKESGPLSQIFRTECNKVPAAVAGKLSFINFQSSMKRARYEGTPPIPDNFRDLADAINDHLDRYGKVDDERFFQTALEGDKVVVFVVKQLQHLIESCNEMHLDGTFKIIPKKPKSRQLCTVMAICGDHAFPIALDNYNLSPQCVVSDFEKAIKIAVKNVFGRQTKIVGCWFHFGQAIIRNVQRLGLSNEYETNPIFRTGVKKLIGLALLPPNRIPTGFDCVRQYFREHNLQNMAADLMHYFENQWMISVGPESFSVFGQARRTNNLQENFHLILFGVVGRAHPNIWVFLNSLQEIAASALRDYHRLENGLPITWAPKKKYMLHDEAIALATYKLRTARYSVSEFLSCVSHHFNGPDVSLPTNHDEGDQDNEEVELDALEIDDIEQLAIPMLDDAFAMDFNNDVQLILPPLQNAAPAVPPPRRRGRPRRNNNIGNGPIVVQPRRRGRPRRNNIENNVVENNVVENNVVENNVVENNVVENNIVENNVVENNVVGNNIVENNVVGNNIVGNNVAIPPRQRGRPRRNNIENNVVENNVVGNNVVQNNVAIPPRQRGRPRRNVIDIGQPDDRIFGNPGVHPYWFETVRILEADERIPLREIRVQRNYLRSQLIDMENCRLMGEDQGDVACSVCLTNAATRLAFPCCHRLCCSACAVRLVNIEIYYDDRSPKPITCGQCRALIGDLRRFF